MFQVQKGCKLGLGAGHWNQRTGTYHQIQHSVHGEGGVSREEGLPARAREGHESRIHIPVHIWLLSSLPGLLAWEQHYLFILYPWWCFGWVVWNLAGIHEWMNKGMKEWMNLPILYHTCLFAYLSQSIVSSSRTGTLSYLHIKPRA